VYGEDGAWAQLFPSAPGFCGSILYRSVSEADRYITTDLFTWERLMLINRDACQQLDARTGHLTVREAELVASDTRPAVSRS